ncbi:MAG TPA: 2-oxo acid dehydrogenase subunit E2, partial [Solirubrobacterales bacterium]|nr:2-oxo acid dehydrogenase subunit E2 [Solirubrobacterales bacterium]
METARGSVEVRDPSKPQQAAARRVAESKATIPHLYLDAAIQIRAAVEPRDLVARVVKASASALREHPAVNGAYRDGRFEAYSRINIGIVLAGRDGTVVPTIFDADTLELDEIASVLA